MNPSDPKAQLIERIKSMLPWVNRPDVIAEEIASAWIEDVEKAKENTGAYYDGYRDGYATGQHDAINKSKDQ